MPIGGVIFDMDGLMLDTEPLYMAAWQRASADCGYSLSSVQYLNLIGRRTAEAEALLVELFGANFPLDRFRVCCKQREEEAFSLPPQKKPGVDEILEYLGSRTVPLAVATATDRARTLRRLSSVGILEYFRAIASGDEVKHGKPSPDLYLLAAERLGVPPEECLVFEDSEPGVRSASRAGMRVVMVPDLKPPSDELRSLAHALFASLHDAIPRLPEFGFAERAANSQGSDRNRP